MKARRESKRTKHHKETAASGGRTLLSSASLGRLRKFVLPVVVFFWPFLYLVRFVVPINGGYRAIGNDFYGVYGKYKIYLLSCLSQGRFPLWSPSEGAGFPLYTNPIVQAFYPFNLLLTLWCKFLGGYRPLDYQIFAVFGLSIFALGLFMWLRLLNKNLRAVIFSVLVISVSFRLVEILRFPNAVHTACWYPWILYALTKIILSRSAKRASLFGLLLSVFLLFFLTAGYPYYVYYSLFLFPPYMLIFLLKPLRLRLFGWQPIHWKRAILTLMIVGAVVLLICSPYLLGIKHLMAQTVNRGGDDFAYATQHVFSFEDTLGSLVYPPAAQTEGWYFFSITGLLLIFLYLLTGGPIAYDRLQTVGGENQIPATRSSRELWLKLFFIIWLAVITYITYGRSSYLFIFLWKFMPGFSSLRVWGRLNIILAPIIAWLLSIAYTWFESLISDRDIAARRSRLWLFSPIVTVVAVYAAVLGVQLYLYLNKVYDPYWPHRFNHLAPQRVKFIVYGVVAVVVVLSLVIFGKRIQLKSTRFLPVVVAALVIVATIEMRPVGTHIWTYEGKPWERRVNLDMPKINEASFRFRRLLDKNKKNMLSLGPNFNVGVVPTWYFSRYADFLEATEDEPRARNILLGVVDARKVFFSESIEHETVQSFLSDTWRYRDLGRLVSYTGDELYWEIAAPVDGYLSFIDNWDRGWKVFVDDEPSEIKLLFGTFKSVRLTPGQHRVRFSYQPGLF